MKEPHCKNHPDRIGIGHFRGYSLCGECFERRLRERLYLPLDEYGRTLEELPHLEIARHG